MQIHGIKASNDKQSQLELAHHFGVGPAAAHNALVDAQTLQKLFPHLLRAAGGGGEALSVQQVLSSGSAAVGMLHQIGNPAGAGCHLGHQEGELQKRNLRSSILLYVQCSAWRIVCHASAAVMALTRPGCVQIY